MYLFKINQKVAQFKGYIGALYKSAPERKTDANNLIMGTM